MHASAEAHCLPVNKMRGGLDGGSACFAQVSEVCVASTNGVPVGQPAQRRKERTSHLSLRSCHLNAASSHVTCNFIGVSEDRREEEAIALKEIKTCSIIANAGGHTHLRKSEAPDNALRQTAGWMLNGNSPKNPPVAAPGGADAPVP